MRAQVRGLDRAISNSQDGISMLQTAEGALSETHSILQRMRELSVQAANDTLTQQDRAYIQLEIDELRDEITRIGNTTQFNKKKLLDGSAAALWSSDKLSTKAIINGGLRSIDQFGQKTALEGNFVIDINAEPGKAQVQKTDVFTIKHEDVLMDASTNAVAGVNDVTVNNIPAGEYQVTLNALPLEYSMRVDGEESATTSYLHDNLLLDFQGTGAAQASAATGRAEVTAISIANGTVTVSVGVATAADGVATPVAGALVAADLIFNIADGTLNATASNAGITALRSAGISLGDTRFSGPVDTDQLRINADPLASNEGSTVLFDLGTNQAMGFNKGTAAVTGDPSSDWSTFVVNAPVTGALGSARLLDIMRAEGVSAYTLELTMTSATAATAKLTIGTKEYTASATPTTGTAGPAFTTEAGTITFAQVASGTGVASGDTWKQTATLSSTVGSVTKRDALTEADYKEGLIFKPLDALTSSNSTVTLRAKAVTAGASAQFDILVNGVAATSDGSTVLTTADSTFTVGTTKALSLYIDGKVVRFEAGLGSLDLSKIRLGDEITYATAKEAELVGRYGTAEQIYVDTAHSKSNASALFEVVKVNDVTKSVDFKVTANILNTDGSTTTRVANITLYNDDTTLTSDGLDMDLLGLDLTLNLNRPLAAGKEMSDYYKAGDKLVYNVVPAGDANARDLTTFKIDGQQNQGWSGNWITKSGSTTNDDVTVEGTSLLYGLDATKVNGQEVHLKNFYVNEKDGTVYTGDIVLALDKEFSKKIGTAEKGDVLASFEAAYVGQVAKGDVKLRDLDKFWNSEGRFLLDDAQNLTLTQGDGTRTTVTLYATDTLDDVATKLNSAIASQLGQQSVLRIEDGTTDPAAKKFVTFVNEGKEGTSEALGGTFVIRSVIAGANGEISFAGDEELLKQLSLNELQAAEENSFTVSVWDAHTGKSIASSVKITGNKLIGVVNDNVDVVFDTMANVNVEWNDATKAFTLSKETGSYQTILHLADNTTVYQIGANEGEDMGVNIGDMRSEALGLNGVLVTDRESAARAITVIDSAIDKVSSQRARLGAYQNRLEHTIANLTVAGENLTAAESRIRDTDMAKEMMNFTKLQIMLQAGTSMLAQANTLPQNVLSLLR
jgi:flagellin